MPRGMGMGGWGGGGRGGGRRHGEAPVMPVTGFEGRAVRMLLSYLWPRGQADLKLRVIVSVVLLLAAKFVSVYVPLAYKYAVDALTALAQAGTEALALGIVVVPVALIAAYGGLRVGAMMMNEIRDIIFSKVSQRAIRRVALQTFNHMHALSLRFHLERQTGGLSRALERGTNGIDQLLRIMLNNIVPTIVEFALVLGILWALYSGWFSAVVVMTIAGYVLFTVKVTEWRLKYRREMNRTDSEASTRAVDSLLNYETVKYFGNEAHEAQRYDDALRRYESAAIKSKTTQALLNIGQGVIIAIGLTAMMILAGYGVAAGRMTVGDFVAVNAYLIQLSIPLNWLGVAYREVYQSLVDMESMFALLEVPQEVADKPGAPALALGAGVVRFEDVHFGYDSRRPILKGVSFEVPAGSTVAIVGSTGAGKSTVSRLLFRFYDIDSGRITIDGQDIREVTQASLRAAIGIVPQDTVLFNDSIHYNINFGRPAADEAEIDEAARLAQIRDFVRALPDGYDTIVGERGLKLSGGEKQRVAIARTVLKGPRIFLFDEATSSLDTHTEKEIQRSLKQVSANRTTLVIAHRLSTVVEADQIIVLEDGKVVERGRHAELLAEDGRYASMWRRQLETSAKAQQALDARAATPMAAAE